MIRPINQGEEEKWDKFVLETSINGNILQTQRFLGYHPKGRFDDASLVYEDAKGNVRAVIPAATRHDSGRKIFVSHPGSTYGGIVFDSKSCTADRLNAIIEELVLYLREAGYSAADLRFAPSFMWNSNHYGLLDYLMQYNSFESRGELTTYVDFSDYHEETLKNFSQGKRTDVNNALKAGMTFRVLSSLQETEAFYELLRLNLAKYDAAPVHTIDELVELNDVRMADDAELVGAFLDGKMVAGGWLFKFRNQKVLHTQYLCADSSYGKISPMTFMYYSAIEYARNEGFEKVSWGISTEEKGAFLNKGLTKSKESFGSLHDVHKRYELAL